MDKMPFEECASFVNCSTPKCPLDPEIEDRVKLKGEEKCKCWKKSRQSIGEKYSNVLQYKGLYKKEYVAKQNWDRLPDETKARIAQQGAKTLKSLKTGVSGHTEQPLQILHKKG